MNYFTTICATSVGCAWAGQNVNPQFGSLEFCPNWKATACWRPRFCGMVEEKVAVMWCRSESEQCRAASITAQKRIWKFISFTFTVSSRQMIPWTVNFSPVDRSNNFPHPGNSNNGLGYSVLRVFIFPGIFATSSIFLYAHVSIIWNTSMEKQLSALSLTVACSSVTLLCQR